MDAMMFLVGFLVIVVAVAAGLAAYFGLLDPRIRPWANPTGATPGA